MLVDNASLTNAAAIEVLEIAAEVKVQVATEAGESDVRMRESITLIENIRHSFEADSPDTYFAGSRSIKSA